MSSSRSIISLSRFDQLATITHNREGGEKVLIGHPSGERSAPRTRWTPAIHSANVRSKWAPDISTLPATDLKRVGLKVTLPRLKVLEALESADPHHLSAEDVYKRLIDSDDSVGLATVYRVLTQFETAGIVERHHFDDGHAVYELAKEIHHDHMVDVDNGTVTEFVNEKIEKLQQEIAAEHGFDLVDHELVLYVRKSQPS